MEHLMVYSLCSLEEFEEKCLVWQILVKEGKVW
jgi:hypothetical protein